MVAGRRLQWARIVSSSTTVGGGDGTSYATGGPRDPWVGWTRDGEAAPHGRGRRYGSGRMAAGRWLRRARAVKSTTPVGDGDGRSRASYCPRNPAAGDASVGGTGGTYSVHCDHQPTRTPPHPTLITTQLHPTPTPHHPIQTHIPTPHHPSPTP